MDTVDYENEPENVAETLQKKITKNSYSYVTSVTHVEFFGYQIRVQRIFFIGCQRNKETKMEIGKKKAAIGIHRRSR
jgi:hypothetical protein